MPHGVFCLSVCLSVCLSISLLERASSGRAFCSGDGKPSGNLGAALEKHQETLPLKQLATSGLSLACR